MFTSASPGRKNPAAKALFSLFYCLCLALLLFPVSGCQMEDDNDSGIGLNPGLIGTWTSPFADKYIISANKFSYDDGYGGGYAGTIRYVSNFSNSSGVVIIEYDEGHKQTYFDGSVPEGNFIGVYYKELIPNTSIKMGGAYIAGGAEKKTLDEAIAAFTENEASTYISLYGDYAR